MRSILRTTFAISAFLLAYHTTPSCAATATPTTTTQTMTAQAMSVGRFVETIGVGTHMSYGYANDAYYAHVPQVIADLGYIGVDNVRDNTWAFASIETMAAAGIKFDFVGGATYSDQLASTFQHYDTFEQKYPGQIVAIEGMNEVSSTESWGGQVGQAAAQLEQVTIYADAKADPLLSNIPIYDYTTIAATVTTRAGAADYLNQHVYPQDGSQPGQGWIDFGSPTMRFRQYNLPDVMTEFGYNTIPQKGWNVIGVDEPTQAKGILNGVFDAVFQGVSRTYLYELCDEEPDPDNTNTQLHYGLFHNDHTPKASATTLHNLTTLLRTNSATPVNASAKGVLNYTLTNMPTTAYNLLLQKDDGTFVIAIWNETPFWNNKTGTPINSAPIPDIGIDFGQGVTVTTYDPTIGLTPISIQKNLGGEIIPVPDHVILLEVTLDAPSANCGSISSGSTVWINSSTGSSSSSATTQQCTYGGTVTTTWTNQVQQLCTNGVLSNTGQTQEVGLTTQAPVCNAPAACGSTPSGSTVWANNGNGSSSATATAQQCPYGGSVTTTWTNQVQQLCTNGVLSSTGKIQKIGTTQTSACNASLLVELNQTLNADLVVYNAAVTNRAFYATQYDDLMKQSDTLHAQKATATNALVSAQNQLSADEKVKASPEVLATDQLTVATAQQSLTSVQASIAQWNTAYATHHTAALAFQTQLDAATAKVAADKAAIAKASK